MSVLAATGSMPYGATIELMDPLLSSLFAKIEEQIERTGRLAGLLPPDKLEWRPPMAESWPMGVLIGHLLECLAGFCAVLWVVRPEQLAHFSALRELPVNHLCPIEEARERLDIYRERIREGFGLLRDADLAATVPTIFVPEGETLLTLLLGNLEHLINHKHQLFTCLKLLGVDASSRDLYRFRGA